MKALSVEHRCAILLTAVLLTLTVSACDREPLVPAEVSPATSAGEELAGDEPPIPASVRPRSVVEPLVVGKVAADGGYPGSRRMEQTVELPHAGRYALIGSGEQPVAVQWIDRMIGPSAITPARSDEFFSAGPLKVVLHGQPDATGDMKLAVRAFSERHTEPFPLLQPVRLLETSLEDFEQRSWWLAVDRPRWVTVEVAGRYLEDLRLWRDGEWLTDVRPDHDQIDPEGGQPLQWRMIHTWLDAGLYRLTAYGGPGAPWAEESGDAPLYVRKGIPKMPAWGWWEYQTSPFGVDRWRIDSDANAFELRLEQARSARLSIASYQESISPTRASGQVGQLSHDARQPEIFLSDTRSGSRLITVTHSPGQTYRLSALHHATSYSLGPDHAPRRWIGVAGMSDPADTVDATLVALDTAGWQRGEHHPLAEQLPVLSEDAGWAGRFNLLEPISLLLRIREGGDYIAELTDDSEAMAAFRLEPVYQSAPGSGAARWQSGSRHQWELNPGLYRLHLRPDAGHPGIAGVRLRPASMAPEAVDQAAPIRDGGSIGPVAPGRNRMVQVNDFDQGRGGLIIRPVPLDPGDPLPVTQAPESVRGFPIRARKNQTLVAMAPDGGRMPLAESPDGPWQEELAFDADGTREVHVQNPAARSVIYNLHWLQESDGTITPDEQSVLTEQQRESLSSDSLPALDEHTGLLVQMPVEGSRSHRIQVTRPALYRLESSGLLDTRGELRDRIRPALASAHDGGSGRNFLIQRYLRDGEFRLVSQTRGRSAGSMGLKLERAPVRDAGSLPVNTPARATIVPGEALRYRIAIQERDKYTVHARGLEQDFAVQIDGPDGWPVVRPGSGTPLTVELEQGLHELILIPQGVTARAVTTISAPPAPLPDLAGHGPHPLPLNVSRNHRWREPGDPGAERIPDQWQFELRAPKQVRIQTGEFMEAELFRRDVDDWKLVEKLSATDTDWRDLDAGPYLLQVRAGRVDDRRDYQLRVSTRELPMGSERQISVPGQIHLSLAQPSLVRLGSLSDLDVEAELVDGDGQRIAFSDHRPDDWNFLISQSLPAGHYRLLVSASDGGSGSALIRFDGTDEQRAQPLAAGEARQLRGEKGEVIPLVLPDRVPEHGYPLVFFTRSHGTHGVALEHQQADGWETLQTTVGREVRSGLVLDPSALTRPHRLRIWPLDDVAEPIRVVAQGVDQARLARSPVRTGELEDGYELTGMKLDRIGMARMEPAGSDWAWAGAEGVFQPVRAGWIPLAGDVLWLLGPSGGGEPAILPVQVEPQRPLSLPVGEAVGLAVENTRRSRATLRLWQLQAPLAPPVLQPAPGPGTGWALAAPDQDQAIGVALPGRQVDSLRLGRSDGDRRTQPMTLNEHRLPVADHGRLGDSDRTLLLEPGTAARLVLGGDRAGDLRFSLPPQVAVILADRRDRIEQVLFSGSQSRSLHAASTGERLWLANIGSDAAPVRVSRPSPAGLGTRLEGQARGAHFGFRGTRVVQLDDAGEHEIIELGGDVIRAVFVDEGGRAYPAREGQIRLPDARVGVLYLEHGTGAIGWWSPPIPHDPAPFALEVEEQGLISMSVPAPGRIRWLPPDGPESRHWITPDQPLTRLVSPGSYRYDYAPLPPTGKIESMAPEWTTTALLDLEEGVGEPVQLGPGQSQAFWFELEQPRTIGIGLQIQRDVAHAVLMDAEGRVLGEGVAQMHQDLPAGGYVLRVDLPADQTPVLLRPTLVGSQPPHDTIPDHVRQRLTSE